MFTLKKMKKAGLVRYGLLYGGFLLYSCYGVLAKYAGGHPIISPTALCLYAAAFCVLALYALLWQQVLKRMPLSVAYPNKAVTIILGMLWGALLFSEVLTWNKMLGAAVIISGIVLVTRRG
jgi:multidrug transporter EmrE-like cation transporter